MPPIKFYRGKSYGGFRYGYYRIGNSYTDAVQPWGRPYTSKARMTKALSIPKKVAALPPTPAKTPKTNQMARARSVTMRSRSRVRSRSLTSSERAAYNFSRRLARARRVAGVRTAPVRRRRPRYGGPQTGLSGGFVSRRTSENAFAKYASKGVIGTHEAGAIVTQPAGTNNNSRPIAIGHATIGAQNQLLRLTARALTKKLMEKAGKTVSNLINDTFPSLNFRIIYYWKNLADGVENQTIYTPTTASFLAFADWLTGRLDDSFANRFADNMPQVTRLSLYRGTTFDFMDAEIDLSDSSIHVMVKSTLKIQNRTIAVGVDDDNNSKENVANQPLYGKSYYGKGAGLVFKTKVGQAASQKAILANVDTGIIGTAFNNASVCREPPLPTMFVGIKKSGKVKIEPGQVMTSTVTSKHRMKLNEFWSRCFVPDNTTGVNRQQMLGQQAVFIVEKMLCVTADDTPPIMGCEINQRIGVIVNIPTKTVTQEIVQDPLYYTITA